MAGNAHRFFVGVSYSAGRIDKDESTTTYTQECRENIHITIMEEKVVQVNGRTIKWKENRVK